MIEQLYREANVRSEYTFIDHHGGLVDARTGRPIATKVASSDNVTGAAGDEGEEGGEGDRGFGYDFFGEQDAFSKVLGASRQKRRTAGHALHINDY